MDIYPLIAFQNNTILDGIHGKEISLEEIIAQTKAEHPLYIYEENINDAHFGIYQRLSGQRDLWIDAQPRNHEDVVDLVTAGATSIIIRPKAWWDLHENVKETVEVAIYAAEELTIDTSESHSFFSPVEGYIVFGLQQQERVDFKQHQWIKNKLRSTAVYIYDNQVEKLSNWQSLSITGIITDLSNIKEFTHGR